MQIIAITIELAAKHHAYRCGVPRTRTTDERNLKGTKKTRGSKREEKY